MPDRFQPLLRFGGGDKLAGQGGSVRVVAVQIVLAAAVGEGEVGDGQVGQIFLHVKGCILGVEAAEQHQSQCQ